uniref:Uncharacterized protein n=1 Tax=Oncorhynchus kisutch TaxID=8019 RepID=A0A8C7DUW4_ONCKI
MSVDCLSLCCKTCIELLQQDQKMIEERKSARNSHYQKTLADMVTNDTGILRGVIEQASWDYNTAR